MWGGGTYNFTHVLHLLLLLCLLPLHEIRAALLLRLLLLGVPLQAFHFLRLFLLLDFLQLIQLLVRTFHVCGPTSRRR